MVYNFSTQFHSAPAGLEKVKPAIDIPTPKSEPALESSFIFPREDVRSPFNYGKYFGNPVPKND
jgi:hypothetical protein